ncbi:MAG TPA: flagellar hook-basal body protein [Bacillales bacterium]|nr:flagellar hook-basal body protein [Bacillales bacterium]
MNQGAINAAVTMGQLQKQIDTIGHNLANLNTYGYKRRQVEFSDLLYQQVNNLPIPEESNADNRLTPGGIRLGSGGALAETNVNLKLGAIQETGRALDFALLDPNQFLQIDSMDANGDTTRMFTRDGALYLQPDAGNADRLNLVTKNGYFVIGTNGPIQIPAGYDKIEVAENGTIRVKMRDGSAVEAGRLDLVNILRPQLLESVGGNAYAFGDLQGLNLNENDVMQAVPQQDAQVRQGALESSNVDLATAMTRLLNAQRAYQFNARAVTIADESAGVINNIR